MKFCEEDEVRINPDKINCLHYGSFNDKEDQEDKVRISKLLKTRAVILEADWDKHVKHYEVINGVKTELKSKGEWSYFVEFKGDFKLKEWFLESELILI